MAGADIGNAIAVDGAGSAHVTGSTTGAFPTTTGAFQTSANGDTDGFVTKLDVTGSAAVYSTYLGGAGFDTGYGIAVDQADSAYVTGDTASANFPTTVGAFDTSLDSEDAFVTKLDPAGATPLYSTYLGGSSGDIGYGIAVDAGGSAYATGRTAYDRLPWPKAFLTLTGADHLRYLGPGDRAFDAALATSTDFLRWALYGDPAAKERLPADGNVQGVARIDGSL